MAGKVVNSSFVLLSKFGASRQESASKTATSHIREPLCTINTNLYPNQIDANIYHNSFIPNFKQNILTRRYCQQFNQIKWWS
ncbi:MAG TPA: hypothetical protein VFW78_07675, partial [Bacteroidia bacterium]|nr:hypothetical protein [Bacteroidia bacterium]